MLAIFAILVVGTTTVAYVGSKDTSVMVAVNAQRAADARALAGAGMELTEQLLRDSDSNWRTNHTNGRLLSNYALDGGTITVDMVDIVRRNAGVANPVPISTTTELEVTVTSTRNDTSWQSVAHMSVPSVVKGQYAIFANKILAVYGTNNFVGRWDHAPMSAQQLRVNLGCQALSGSWNASSVWQGNGVWLENGANFESVVAGVDIDDPDTQKSTWVYYPNAANSFVVQGAHANQVAAKRMEPADSISLITPPTAPSTPASIASTTTTQTVDNQTRTYTPFRIKAALLPALNLRNFDVKNNSVVTLTAGNYEIWGSWKLTNARVIIQGTVNVLVKPNLLTPGLDWTDSSVELDTNASLNIYNGYSMNINHCWIGSRYICTDEPNAALRDGEAHKRYWLTGSFTNTVCDPTIPTSPRYIEPWRIRFYPDPSFLSSFFSWTVNNSSVVGSFYLPSNPIYVQGNSKVFGRIAANHVFVKDTASFYYDHALDEVSGLTEGTTPARGDPEEMFPVRVVKFGFDADNAR